MCRLFFLLLGLSLVSGSLGAQLSGSYVIGGLNPDFATIQAAADSLNAGGVSGPVTFDIQPGTYVEQVHLDSIVGTSSSNSIVFRSSTGFAIDVQLRFASDFSENYTLSLNGSDHIRFEDLTIRATDPQFGRVIVLDQAATEISFANCRFQGISTTSNSEGLSILRAEGDNAGLRIENCRFENGSRAISIASSNAGALQNEFIDNHFTDQYLKAIQLERVDAAVIEGNTIVTTSPSTSYEAIHLMECDSGFSIQQNVLQLANPDKALHIWRCFADANRPATIANNAIYIAGGPGSSSAGVFMFWSEFVDIVYNSVHIAESNASSVVFTLNSVISDKIRLYNNSFSQMGLGKVIDIGWLPNIEGSDHNNFYTAGDFLAVIDTFFFADLLAWQDSTGMDSNAISADPIYVLAPDLHLPDTALEGKALALANFGMDLDGDPRDPVTPDIGADEFLWLAPVADMNASPKNGCSPLLVNFSDQSQGTVTEFAWDVDGDGNDDYFTDAPSHLYTSPGLYSVRLIASNPGGSDTLIWADSIEVELCTALEEPRSGFRAWPNPADQALKIDGIPAGTSEIKIRLINAAGQLVGEEKRTGLGETISVHTAGFPAGIYLLQLQLADQSPTALRFVIQH